MSSIDNTPDTASGKAADPQQIDILESGFAPVFLDGRLIERIPDGAETIACEQGGRSLDSAQFAGLLKRAREDDRDLAFLIGGAFGLPPNVSSRAAFKLALAPWTLPHEIARLVLVEQIYRAGTIVRGEPYHK